MNLEQLYEKLKDALYFFDLSWRDKDKVSVSTTQDGDLCLSYQGMVVTVPLKK